MVFGSNNQNFNPPPTPSTPKQAPWSDAQQANQSLQSILDKLTQIATLLGGQGPGPSNILTAGPLTNVLHYSFNQLAAGIYLSNIIDWTKGSRLLVKVESTLDQPVTLQPQGNSRNAPFTNTNIGVPVVIAAQGNRSFGFGWGNWFPYIWVQCTVAVAPVQGYLDVSYMIQS